MGLVFGLCFMNLGCFLSDVQNKYPWEDFCSKIFVGWLFAFSYSPASLFAFAFMICVRFCES